MAPETAETAADQKRSTEDEEEKDEKSSVKPPKPNSDPGTDNGTEKDKNSQDPKTKVIEKEDKGDSNKPSGEAKEDSVGQEG